MEYVFTAPPVALIFGVIVGFYIISRMEEAARSAVSFWRGAIK